MAVELGYPVPHAKWVWVMKNCRSDYDNSARTVPRNFKEKVDFSNDGREAIKALGPLFKLTQVYLSEEVNSDPQPTKPIGTCTGSGGRNKGFNWSKGLLPLPEDWPSSNSIISKYWKQRYLLFSRFDEGIQMDVEGWFSVTPEPIAKHHALRCGGGTIVDCFTGVGGNVIQFAARSRRVIAIDIDPMKIQYAKHNAAIYGVDSRRIQFVLGDSTVLGPKLKGDVVFLSPPWGGPDYSKQKTFDMKTMLKPRDGQFLFNMAKKIAPKVVMFLPRNVDINQLAELALSASPPWSLEVEKNYLNGKFKAITAYFSESKL